MGEFALLPEQNVVYLPFEVSDEQGALVEPASVALNAIDLGGVTAGSSVLVAGAGPIGALVAMAASASGATKVFVFEPNGGRRKRISLIHAGFDKLVKPGNDKLKILVKVSE
jgi:(R,R)-butanediol dehydrogenase/meso-butanediol dehydrogenase/diacetyl reductase